MVRSEERVKRVSNARSQRVDEFRQGREKQHVLLQLHKEQLQADAEAEASAAAAAEGGDAEEKKAPRVKAEEDRNLMVIIKADVQVCIHLPVLLSAYLSACFMHTGARYVSLCAQASVGADCRSISAIRLLTCCPCDR